MGTGEFTILTDDGGEFAMPADAPIMPTAAATAVGGCEWPITYADCQGCEDVYARWTDPAARVQAKALFEEQAVEFLWNWTNGVFGVCDVAVRPCRTDADGNDLMSTFWGRGPRFDPGFPRMGAGAPGAAPWAPVLIAGQWFNVTCGCLTGCSCTDLGARSITLPGAVQSVTEVRVDGKVLPPAAYRVDNHRTLIRLDGGVWPARQDMLLAPDRPGTFEVVYKRGIPVPLGGQAAAGRLACELAMAACGDQECSLPDNWQTLTRQGISINADPNMDGSTLTGIWSIDEWVKSVNRPKRYAAVRSVDYRR